MNYSGVVFPETRRWLVGVDLPWCTGHCPVRQTREHFGFLLLLFLKPNLFFLLICVEPMAPVEHII
jgi:hypothetical protein